MRSILVSNVTWTKTIMIVGVVVIICGFLLTSRITGLIPGNLLTNNDVRTTLGFRPEFRLSVFVVNSKQNKTQDEHQEYVDMSLFNQGPFTSNVASIDFVYGSTGNRTPLKTMDSYLNMKHNYKIVFFMESQDKTIPSIINEAALSHYLNDTDFFLILSSPADLPRVLKAAQDFIMKSKGSYNYYPGEILSSSTSLIVSDAHLEIHRWLYPRGLAWNQSQDWMKCVYDNGTYPRGHDDLDVFNLCKEGKKKAHSYRYKKTLLRHKRRKQRRTKVIAMTLFGTNDRYTMNALRNCQLAKLNFPGWTLRFYVPLGTTNFTMEERDRNAQYLTPMQILEKMMKLGADFKEIDTKVYKFNPTLWRFLVVEDPEVDIFIIRDCDSLLTPRDAAAVDDWLKTKKTFHCMRDHPSHRPFAINAGMWGARRLKFLNCFDLKKGEKFSKKMTSYGTGYLSDTNFLTNVVWPKIKEQAYCHDSVSCTHWPHSHPFPVKREGYEHVGGVYDMDDNLRQGDVDILKRAIPNTYCLPKK